MLAVSFSLSREIHCPKKFIGRARNGKLVANGQVKFPAIQASYKKWSTRCEVPSFHDITAYFRTTCWWRVGVVGTVDSLCLLFTFIVLEWPSGGGSVWWVLWTLRATFSHRTQTGGRAKLMTGTRAFPSVISNSLRPTQTERKRKRKRRRFLHRFEGLCGCQWVNPYQVKAKVIFAPMAPEPIGSESDVAFAFARSALALNLDYFLGLLEMNICIDWAYFMHLSI